MGDLIASLDPAVIWPIVGQWGGRILAALLIFLIGRWVAAAIASAVARAIDRAGMEPTLSRFLHSLIYMTLLVFFRPFKAGDYVEAGGVGGTVDSIGIFNTVIKTPDNRVITVPNSLIYGGTITNYSAETTRRIDLVFGVGYEDDVGRVKQLILNVLEADERILKEPAPTIMMLDLADSSVNIAVRPWVDSADYWATRGDVLERVKKALEDNGMSIPYPQRDLHIVGQVSGAA